MVSLYQALENSRNSFTSGEFIAKLSGLVRIVTDSKNSVSNEDLINYYSEGLLSILTELGIQTKIIDNYVENAPPFLIGERIESSN